MSTEDSLQGGQTEADQDLRHVSDSGRPYKLVNNAIPVLPFPSEESLFHYCVHNTRTWGVELVKLLVWFGEQVDVHEQVLFFPGCWEPPEKEWGHLTAALETKAIPPILLTGPPLITGVDGNGGREWGIPNGRGIQNAAWEEICVCVFEI